MFGLRDWAKDDSGAVAVEFVMVAPIFLMLLIGIVVYGGWYWTANSVQTLASEAARAAVGGLDATEQSSLARDYVSRESANVGGVTPDRTATVVRTSANAIQVEVVYDASKAPIFAFGGLIPAPPKVIRRSAVVVTGGY